MKVCIFWSQDIYQDPWDYLLTAFGLGPDNIYLLVLPGEEAPRMTKTTGASNIIHSMDNLPPGPLVVSSPKDAKALQGEKCLHCFEHPGDDAIYVFGADDVTLSKEMFGDREIDHSVYVPTKGGNIHSHVAAAMVLYDRRYKEWLTQ